MASHNPMLSFFLSWNLAFGFISAVAFFDQMDTYSTRSLIFFLFLRHITRRSVSLSVHESSKIVLTFAYIVFSHYFNDYSSSPSFQSYRILLMLRVVFSSQVFFNGEPNILVAPVCVCTVYPPFSTLPCVGFNFNSTFFASRFSYSI